MTPSDSDPSPAVAASGSSNPAALRLAIVGAGPVGLSLALEAARTLPQAHITVFDAREASRDISGDPRTLALSLGSVQVLRRLGVWDAVAGASEPIREVHVSQQQPALLGLLARPALGPLADTLARLSPSAVQRLDREPAVTLTAAEQAVPQLGAVASYGTLVAPLQAAWVQACQADEHRLAMRFGVKVGGLKPVDGGVEVDADIAETFDLVVVAEGGVFADQARKALARDYRQTAWVGTVTLAQPHGGTAFERFTPQGPAALLPLPPREGEHRASLVWCVPTDDDPVRALTDAQRTGVLNTIFHERVGPITHVTPLKAFPLGLNAETTLVKGRTVRIGNAAQTLHPVAGQGLNLGLRDAMELVFALRRTPSDIDAALRRVEWQRAPDRWTLIATTDFLARSFTWDLPGLTTLRGLGLAALQAAPPVKSLLARQMMYGRR